MKIVKKIWVTTFALLLLGLVGVGIVLGTRAAWDVLSSPANLADPVTSIPAAILLGALLLAWTVRSGQGKAARAQLHQKKGEAYRRLVDAWSRSSSPEIQQSGTWQAELRDAEKDLLLWGSRRVIRHYLAFRRQGAEFNASLAEKAIAQMRKDVGESNLGLEEGALLELLLGSSAVPLTRRTATKERPAVHLGVH